MIEEKIVRRNDEVQERQFFKWDVVEERERKGGRGHHYKEFVLQRETTIKHFAEITALEEKFFYQKSMIMGEITVDKFLAFLLILVGLLPGILYIVIVRSRNKTILKNNAQRRAKMEEISQEVKRYY